MYCSKCILIYSLFMKLGFSSNNKIKTFSRLDMDGWYDTRILLFMWRALFSHVPKFY